MAATTPANVESPGPDGAPVAATTAGRLPLIERFVDRMNPILVKEVRQAFKGRGFVLAFALLIFSCWLISVIGALQAGSSLEYYSWAPRFFSIYFIPLAFAIGVVIPFMAYNSMLSERVDDTFDMLSITTLRARKIVNGKLANAFVQVMLLYAAFTPFVAFTSLLQGFRFFPVFLALSIALVSSLTLCTISLFLSTLARTRFVQVLISLVLIVGLLYSCSAVQLLFEPGFWNIPFIREVGLVFGSVALAMGGIILLMREYAIAAITFETDNRSTGVRIVTSIIVVVGWLILFVIIQFTTAASLAMNPQQLLSAVSTLTILTSILVGCTAFGMCSEPVRMSRRVRNQMGRFPLVSVYLISPWLPGCSRGFLFTLLHVIPGGLLTYSCWINVWSSSTRSGSVPYWAESGAFSGIAAVLYVVFFSGLVTLVSQLIHRAFPNSRTLVVRAWSLITIAALVIFPPILVLVMEEYFRTRIVWEIWMITCPFLTFSYLMDFGRTTSSASWGIVYALTVLTVMVAVSNLHGIYWSFVELLQGKKSQTPCPTAPTDS